jgi:DNA repair exonuclease SbcCD nuclease subunit
MTGFRFLHLADLHLETSFGGLPSTRERLRRATFEAFEAAVDYAIEGALHAVVVAGDLYDDPLLSIRTELMLERQVARLDEAGVWFVAVCGNHDPGGPRHRSSRLGLETDHNGARRERVRILRDRHPEAVRITDRGGEPVGIVVGAGHMTETESTNLAEGFPRVAAGLPVVGLLHSHVSSARTASSHDRYAPSGQADFERLEYSYWALGHIHMRQRAVSDLPVHYAGNLQGRNPKETGAKGGLVVEARAGIAAEPEFVQFAPVRWERLIVDQLPDSHSAAALVNCVSSRVAALGGSSDQLALRVELVGETPLAPTLRVPSEVEALEAELAARTGALEVQLRDGGVMRPIDRTALSSSPTVLTGALELIERAAREPELLAGLSPDELAAATEPEARDDYLRSLLDDLSEELIERSIAVGTADSL